MTVKSNNTITIATLGWEILCQFFNQREAKPKPIAPCTHDFSCSLGKLQVIARNSDWFIALFAPIVIGWSDNFGVVYSTDI